MFGRRTSSEPAVVQDIGTSSSARDPGPQSSPDAWDPIRTRCQAPHRPTLMIDAKLARDVVGGLLVLLIGAYCGISGNAPGLPGLGQASRRAQLREGGARIDSLVRASCLARHASGDDNYVQARTYVWSAHSELLGLEPLATTARDTADLGRLRTAIVTEQRSVERACKVEAGDTNRNFPQQCGHYDAHDEHSVGGQTVVECDVANAPSGS